MTASSDLDFLVVGGGVVGMSIAYGLARAGERVQVLDEGDTAFRASRGNHGLVWVQGKGLDCPSYAKWTVSSARRWPEFARQLNEDSGIDVELSQIGGLSICLTDAELAKRVTDMGSLRRSVGDDYVYRVMSRQELAELCPAIGPEVVGGVYCPLDGHVSPLRLLLALVRAFKERGGHLTSRNPVTELSHHNGHYVAKTEAGVFRARKLVLAAGLGNLKLAPDLGLEAPIKPIRGQMVVTERLQPFLRHPWHSVRQTSEGVVQIGASKEDAGFDDGTTLEQLSRVTQHAIRCFPLLADVNIVRSWGALRPMSPDGYPIYQESGRYEGAFAVNCHSGITLAAEHAASLVDWVRGKAIPSAVSKFNVKRFDVQKSH
jgi:glycine/D-amino acid oxidase-like deaminating enzyme